MIVFFLCSILYPLKTVKIIIDSEAKTINLRTKNKVPKKFQFDKLQSATTVSGNDFPILKIGILSLNFMDTTVKILSRKYDKKNYNDFVFNDIPTTDIGKSKIKDFLETVSQYSFLPTSYSKYLTYYKNVFTVPLDINQSAEQLVKLLPGLDGLFFTGGNSDFFKKAQILLDQANKNSNISEVQEPSKYMQVIQMLLNKAKQINDSGTVFPVWGTCLGFEAMILNEAAPTMKFDHFTDLKKTHSMVLTDDTGKPIDSVKQSAAQKTNDHFEMQIKMDSEQIKLQIDPIKQTLTQNNLSINYSLQFKQFLENQFSNMKSNKYYYYYHNYGFTVENFINDKNLTDNLNILAISDEFDFNLREAVQIDEATNKILPQSELIQSTNEMINDDTSSTFVAAIEYKKYPFYAVQFHPEKPLYDYSTNPSVNHDVVTATNNRKFSGFFINRVRKAKMQNIKNNKLSDINLDISFTSFTVKNVGLYTELLVLKQI